MLFSYNWLQDYVKEKLPKPEKLAELLTIHTFEVEEVKKKGTDWVLDINVRPNRASDCFSHLGIAREIAVITNSKFQIPSSKPKEDKELKVKDFVNVEIRDKNTCPRYTARVFTDVKVGPSPKYIQERLEACGVRPINNIVDIANYVMLETGQPLHAFDLQKLKDKKIVVRFAKKGEKIVTLDNQKFNLDKEILVIADSKDPVGIAGIKGGKLPEIDKKTKIVVLEGANFERKTIRRGSKKLNLRTDASWRFEHGISADLTEFAINRAAFLIQKEASAKVAKGFIDFYPLKVGPRRIRLVLDYVKRLLGVKISKREILRILKGLEFKILKDETEHLIVEVPNFRLDVSLPEDLIEEIGRIIDFNKIPAIFPKASLIPPKRNENIFWEEKVGNILKTAGFTEVYNYSFIGEGTPDKFSFDKENLLELENPLSRKYKYLRPSLFPNLLKNVRENFKFFDELKIFELGKVYRRSNVKSKELNVEEKRMLTGIIARKEKKEDGLSEIKGITDLLLEKLGLADIWYDTFEPTPEEKGDFWHPKKCGEIKVGDKEIGFFGETKDFEIKDQVLAFEFDFEKLQKLACEEQEFKPVSPYPAAVRDLAVLVPREVKVAEVLNKVNEAGGDLVQDVDLFDLYEGEEIPGGKKNLAFHIVYQAEDRTLKSEEIEKIHQKIIETLEKNPDWEVRK